VSRMAIIAAMTGELKPLVRGWQHERRNGVDLWRSVLSIDDEEDREWVAACAGAGVDPCDAGHCGDRVRWGHRHADLGGMGGGLERPVCARARFTAPPA